MLFEFAVERKSIKYYFDEQMSNCLIAKGDLTTKKSKYLQEELQN